MTRRTTKSLSWTSFPNFSFTSPSNSTPNSPTASPRPSATRGPPGLDELRISATKPPAKAGLLPECFKLSCGDVKRTGHNPRRIVAPENDTFFKNGVRPLWADKHCPRSLSTFQCHTQETSHLKQLISQGNCPHMILQGPPGVGKKSLAMAMLRDVFGDIKALPEHRPFSVQGESTARITVPITSSRYHVEVNLLHIGEFDKDVLPTIFKEINLSTERALSSPLLSQSDFGYKVLVVQNAEKLSVDAQQILRRLMDTYGDACKLVLCCNIDGPKSQLPLHEAIRSRCQIIDVEVPKQEEIVRVLGYIAKKEDITLPKTFGTRIADQCKQSLRRAIVQLEACKNHQYPFTEDQPVHVGAWEETVMQIAADIVEEPTPKRLFIVRATMQSLLGECVSPVLILQKLLEVLLQKIDVQLKKQICHWAGFYETRARTVPDPIYQLEAFLAKFMSIYKNHLNTRTQLK